MQLIPSTLLYSQALALLTQINTNFSAGTLKSPSDIAAQLRNILTQFDQTAGQPLTDFQRFEDGEPPISTKINSILGYIQLDTTILENQVDILNASTIFVNNMMSTLLLNVSNENAALNNKLDNLELYSSSSTSDNMVVFSDSFGNSQLTDLNFLNASDQASIKDGYLILSPQGSLVDLTANATITIVDPPDGVVKGFLGNNQEIMDPSTYNDGKYPNGNPIYKFVEEITQANKLTAIKDKNPQTWVEYEYYSVSDKDKTAAGNFNFTYQVIPTTTGTSTSNTVDWSIGPPNGILEMDLQFDLGSIKSFNYITYTSFGLTNNINTPVLIKSISCSPDETTWNVLHPSDVSVGTNTNDSSLQTTANYTLGQATWAFDAQSARYIRFNIQQQNPIPVNVGHLYYESGDNSATPNYPGSRVQGPIPTLKGISLAYDPANFTSGKYTQYREYFSGKRWAIGISGISIQQINYATTSSLVTKELKVGKTVNRIALDADILIPSDFGSTLSWVNFYISPDNGANWFPINTIEDTNLGIPAVIAFNDPLPVALQDPRVAYYTTPGIVNSLRLKIELKSPKNTETPLVRSYALKVTTK